MSLLEDIKMTLDVTEDTETEDKIIKNIIEDGKQYLRSISPNLTDEDFEKPTRARKLLFNYCRYDYCKVIEAFEGNFISDILLLRQEYEVSEYAKQNTD